MLSPPKTSTEKANPFGVPSALESPTPPSGATDPQKSTSISLVDKVPTNTKSANIILGGDPACFEVELHRDGQFCTQCRGIIMPWGHELPHTQDKDGNIITIAPEGSILAGVGLLDSECMTVVSLVACLTGKGKLYQEVPGLIEMMEKYPISVQAGKRIAKMFQSILGAARYDDPGKVPQPAHIVEAALLNPAMTRQEVLASVKENLSTFKARTAVGEGAVDSESEVGSDSEDSSSDIDETLWKKRRLLTVNQSHAPGPKRGKTEWEWLPGTDLSNAVEGKEEPQKFFLVRRHLVDSNKIEIRQYTGMPGFDFHNPADIAKLNKHISQVKSRAELKSNSKGGPWTLLEKETLLSIITKIKDADKPINWELVASELKDEFKGKVQVKGSPCAKTREMKKGNIVEPARDKFLNADRLGTPDRAPGAIRTQARRYLDIATLLKDMTELPPKKKVKNGENEGWTEPGAPVDNTPAKLCKPKKSAKDKTVSKAHTGEDVDTPETSKKRASDEADGENLKKKVKQAAELSETEGRKEAGGAKENVGMINESDSKVRVRVRGKLTTIASVRDKASKNPPAPPPPATGAAATCIG